MSSPEDFSYRALSDAEESSRPRRATSHPSSFVGVTPPADAELRADAVHLHFAADRESSSPVAPVATTATTGSISSPSSSAKQLHANSSDDWAVEEEGRQEARSHQFSAADCMRRGSGRLLSSGAGSHLRIDVHEHHETVPPSPKATDAASATLINQPSANLHGKDLRQFVAIGSISRRSNSVDWSDTMADLSDEPDHLSLMDPYYDLTRSTLTKLFSQFQPDGA